MADAAGTGALWTAGGSQALPLASELPPAVLSSGQAVAAGPLGLVSVGITDSLFLSGGDDWRVQALPEEMYASGGGRRPPTIAVGDDAVLVLMWSGGENPVPTLWRGTIQP